MSDLVVREHGRGTQVIITLHGGPAAAGDIAPLARELGKHWRVLEPYQRGSSSQPLSVATHAEDLDDLIEQRTRGSRPILVGHSWGAMLALAYAAAQPGSISALVLIACGTFDSGAREVMRSEIESRMNEELRQAIAKLPIRFPDPDARLKALGELLLPLYSSDLATTDLEVQSCDSRAYEETWADMLRLQQEGIYPESFAGIGVPILMLHGARDPHPGTMIRRSLEPYLPQIEYLEWEHCGHYPWLEKAVREEFFAVLRTWLAGHFNSDRHPAPPPPSP